MVLDDGEEVTVSAFEKKSGAAPKNWRKTVKLARTGQTLASYLKEMEEKEDGEEDVQTVVEEEEEEMEEVAEGGLKDEVEDEDGNVIIVPRASTGGGKGMILGASNIVMSDAPLTAKKKFKGPTVVIGNDHKVANIELNLLVASPSSRVSFKTCETFHDVLSSATCSPVQYDSTLLLQESPLII